MALGVYKFGLGNVLPTESRFAVRSSLVMILLFSTDLFQLLKQKSERMIRKSQTCDPLHLLPLDLIDIVVKHLSFANVT